MQALEPGKEYGDWSSDDLTPEDARAMMEHHVQLSELDPSQLTEDLVHGGRPNEGPTEPLVREVRQELEASHLESPTRDPGTNFVVALLREKEANLNTEATKPRSDHMQALAQGGAEYAKYLAASLRLLGAKAVVNEIHPDTTTVVWMDEELCGKRPTADLSPREYIAKELDVAELEVKMLSMLQQMASAAGTSLAQIRDIFMTNGKGVVVVGVRQGRGGWKMIRFLGVVA